MSHMFSQYFKHLLGISWVLALYSIWLAVLACMDSIIPHILLASTQWRIASTILGNDGIHFLLRSLHTISGMIKVHFMEPKLGNINHNQRCQWPSTCSQDGLNEENRIIDIIIEWLWKPLAFVFSNNLMFSKSIQAKSITQVVVEE